jgi:hypothetical protein
VIAWVIIGWLIVAAATVLAVAALTYPREDA